jgi:hypothetical protein
MLYHLTLRSRNGKTGKIPVSTTSSESCPDACPLKESGCYAKYGPLGMHWKLVDSGKRGMSLVDFCQKVTGLPDGQLWRHNQAGDLPGRNDAIDYAALSAIVHANKGKRGFTFTHKPMTNGNNRLAVFMANVHGFTVNLSADNLDEVDELVALKIGPVVTLLPSDAPAKLTTPAGNKVIVCPAQQREDITCEKCALCAIPSRKVVVGFRAHGAACRKAEKVFMMKVAR